MDIFESLGYAARLFLNTIHGVFSYGLILLFIGGLFIYLTHDKQPRHHLTKQQVNNVRPVFHVIAESDKLAKMARTTNAIGNIGTIYYTNDPSMAQGAVISLDYYTAQTRFTAVSDGWIHRDSDARKQAIIPGWNRLKKAPVIVDKVTVYPWHRTHLIPFRWSWTENRPGMLIAGSAMLNTGAILGTTYYPDKNDLNHRQELLLDFCRSRDNELTDIYPYHRSFDKVKYQARYSLNDFERLYFKLLAQDHKRVLKYSVFCHYNGGQIPSSVTVRIIDVLHGRELINATLPNVN